MGYRLLILLGLLFGVLYSLHLLVKDYQALTAASKLLRFLFKRDVNAQNFTMESSPEFKHWLLPDINETICLKPASERKHSVRWRKILLYDTTQCARYFYCGLGSDSADSELRRGFTLMLTLNPREEDKSALEIMKKAFETGIAGEEACRYNYPMCPFSKNTLFELVKHLIGEKQ